MISVQTFNWREWSTLAPDWERVHGLCKDASFFLSHEWVDCWLQTFGRDLSPEILIFRRDAEVVGCCLLVRRTSWIRGLPLRRVYLNCAGENDTDSTSIEYNALLAVPACEDAVAFAMVSFLKQRAWDELMLSGTVEQGAIRTLTESLGEFETTEIPARYVPFAPLREQRRDYLNALSSKTRYHIRRTQRAFEELGGVCQLEIAQNVDDALEMLQEMAALHQARWTARGAAGCFSSDKFNQFHRTLIQQHFERTMFFRLKAGSETIGLLYCFLYDGWVYHYQSGFCYSLDKRRSPGLLTLYFAIDACLAREDIKGFDFMAGDTEYKRSLTSNTDLRPLRWFIVRRRTIPTSVFLLLRAAKRKYVQATEKSRQSLQQPGGSELGEDVSVPAGEGARTDHRNS